MMETLFANGGVIFTIPGLIATLLFAIKTLLLLTGGGAHHSDLATDAGSHPSHIPHSTGDTDHASDTSDSVGFQLVSVQSVLALCMGFGWGGLIALKTLNMPLGFSIAVGMVAGGGMLYAVASLFHAMRSMQSDGTIHLHATQGLEGDVYIAVPPKGRGTGQVRVIVGDRQRFFDAVSEDGQLDTSTRIKVAAVNDNNTLTVRRA